MKKLLVYMKTYVLESILGPLFKLLEASFELLVRKCLGQLNPYFDLVYYRITGEMPHEPDQSGGYQEHYAAHQDAGGDDQDTGTGEKVIRLLFLLFLRLYMDFYGAFRKRLSLSPLLQKAGEAFTKRKTVWKPP